MNKAITSTVYTDHGGRRAYFAAANSAQGFLSRYEENFRARASQLYIIKGGPGTGKSRLMWDMVHQSERAGWQSELYFCSSDPTSLDAVRLQSSDGKSVIFLDGTAPHTMEVTTPGVGEEWIDLGAFWSQEQLGKYREDIHRLMKQKSRHYQNAYHYLAAAGRCEQIARETLSTAIDPCAVQRTAARLLSGLLRKKANSPAGNASLRSIFTDALGMRGWFHLDTLERLAKRTCIFSPCHGAEHRLMEELVTRGAENGAAMIVSYHPLFPSLPVAVLFEDERVLFATHAPSPPLPEESDRYFHTCSTRRLLNNNILREQRSTLRQAEKHREALILAGGEALMAAAEPHFALEQIYREAMDFPAKEAHSQKLAQKLFGG